MMIDHPKEAILRKEGLNTEKELKAKRMVASETSHSDEPRLNKQALVEAYQDMLLIRRFEERASQYGQGLIGGFCHLYIGQEAVFGGEGRQRRAWYHGHRLQGSWAYAGFRHGSWRVMAELDAQQAASKGKGGSMHMFDPDKGFWVVMWGAQVPPERVLLLRKYLQQDAVCLVFMGRWCCQSRASLRSQYGNTLESTCGLCDRK